MEKVTKILNDKLADEFSFLKLYDAVFDTFLNECQITFLYPETVTEITPSMREKIEKTLNDSIDVSAKIKVKFKKSFLDDKLIKNEVLNIIKSEFKAINCSLSEQQIEIFKDSFNIKIEINLASEIKNYFDSINAGSKIKKILEEKFIAEFEVVSKLSNVVKIDEDIGPVEIPTLKPKNPRYVVFDVFNLIGENIAPSPEFIKDNTQPKTSVILAGKISNFTKRTFVRKKGKRAGEEGIYYTFTLFDGSRIDCVYFSSKTNEKKMDSLKDDACIIAVGDLKFGLSNKLTYYIKKIALASIDESSKLIKPVKPAHKNIVKIEDFSYLSQENFLKSQPKYSSYIMDSTFVIYDLETTGIDANLDKIIEIGAVKVEKGVVTKKFSTFINPEIHIPEEATKVNNITDQMVEDAPKIEDVLCEFLEFAKGSIISGYNNIMFDNKFILKEAKNQGLEFNNENIDVYNLVRQKKIESKNHKLTTVAAYLGINLEGAHRAYNDAFATAQILLKLNEVENS